MSRFPTAYGSRAYMWKWDEAATPTPAQPQAFPEKLHKAALAAPRLKEPRWPGRCWLLVKQKGTGAARDRYDPRYDNCRNRARKGCKTCSKHQEHEPA